VTITGPLLAVLAPTAVCVCLVLVSNSVLQAHGYVQLPIFTVLAGGAVKIVSNYFLVANPELNIYGASLGMLLCYAVTLVLNLLLLYRLCSVGGYVRVFARPLLASVLMGAAAWAVHGLVSGAAGNLVAVGVAICAAVAVYLVLVLALKAVSRDDVMLMPKGEKIAKILKI
jgi:stage V sporulation protein B